MTEETEIDPEPQWDEHPGVRSGEQLTLGERAADKMRAAMGSWPFIFIFLLAMAAWASVNTLMLLHPFDPYPYILLNLLLSTIAGLQGGILLISAKRADQIASELAVHTYKVDEKTLDHVVESRKENQEILVRLAEVQRNTSSIFDATVPQKD